MEVVWEEWFGAVAAEEDEDSGRRQEVDRGGHGARHARWTPQDLAAERSVDYIESCSVLIETKYSIHVHVLHLRTALTKDTTPNSTCESLFPPIRKRDANEIATSRQRSLEQPAIPRLVNVSFRRYMETLWSSLLCTSLLC